MFNRTMRKKEKRTSLIYLAPAVILALYLAKTADCNQLKKTVRRGWRKQLDIGKTTSVHEGKIVFGGSFEEGSQVVNRSSSNAPVKDGATIQADFAGWTKGQTVDATSPEALWKRLATSLQCGGDQMKFRAVGPGALQFALERGDAPPMPLSQVPATCGYRMQRNSLGLVMLVPYEGCNVVEEGESYVLPMRWQGIPVSLMCPKSSAAVPESTMATTGIPHYPQYPHPHHFFPFIPPPFPVTTAAPTTTTSTADTAAHHPGHHWPFSSLYAPYPWAFTGPLPAPPKPPFTHIHHHKPQFLPFQGYFPLNPYFPYHNFFPPYAQYPIPMPTTTSVTTTRKKMHPVHHHRHFPQSAYKYPYVLEQLYSR